MLHIFKLCFVLLEVISYGTTITRHISKQPDYLSFPRNALIEVYAKHDDPDVWLVKVTMVTVCITLVPSVERAILYLLD